MQGALRDAFGWSSPRDYWFPEIRSLSGAVAMMTLTLYPYVYLLSRATFLEQSVCALEVSRTLGRGPWAGFFDVALPLARPAIVIGVSLVLMEALNDFGTLATFVHQYASDELLEEASLAALAIVAAGIIPVILLSLGIRSARPGA